MDTESIRAAVLRLFPPGTPAPEVARTLRENGVGRDGVSSYFPPDRDGHAGIRVEFDPYEPGWVKRSFGVSMRFDSGLLTSEVEAREWWTGL